MDARAAIKMSLDMGQMVGNLYLEDMTDEDLMRRPEPSCNHINWQIGHLIVSEHSMLSNLEGFDMPALPDGMAEKYTKEAVGSDSQSDFCTKDELMSAFSAVRAATLDGLSKLSDEDLDRETGVHYAPTYGSMISMHGSHWAMHSGQWVPVRRMANKPVVM